MALQLGALREALLHPGDVELATKAAEEVAGYDSRLAMLDTKLSVLVALVGVVTAIGIGNLWLAYAILSRLPR